MALLSVALNSARTYLNDDAAQVWNDASLIPKIQEAHRELQTMLWEINSPAVRKQSSPITVLANATTVTLPADLLTPFRLVEYAATVETLVDASEMTECNFLPTGVAPTTKLIWWSWQQEAIQLLGASVDRKVVVYYRKLITVPAASGDAIGILFGELFLGARAAAIAHGSVGNKDAYAIVTEFAKANFAKVVAAQRGQQSPGNRP